MVREDKSIDSLAYLVKPLLYDDLVFEDFLRHLLGSITCSECHSSKVVSSAESAQAFIEETVVDFNENGSMVKGKCLPCGIFDDVV